MSTVFLDTETATLAWEHIGPERQRLWQDVAEKRYGDVDYDVNKAHHLWGERCWSDKAALHPEFGLIVCISYAIDDGKVYSLTAEHPKGEVEMLERFADGLRHHPMHNLCAHNGKGFDYHWLARRMVIRGVKLPSQLNTMGKKPWEVKLEDTAEMWGFGDNYRKVSLAVLCMSLGIPSPKETMSGADVPRAWRDGRIDEIAAYCERDVEALRHVYRRLRDA